MHLGRLHAPDSRDHNYLLKSLVPIQRPIFKQWALNWKGDQKDTPQCVGYSWHALLRAKPILQRDPSPNLIYQDAQKIDEWPGEDYEGTSVRAGAKVLQSQGKIKEYRWAFDIETVLNWIGTKGPVVLGTLWTNKMFTPDSKGVVSVGNINSIAGGHAYLCLSGDQLVPLLDGTEIPISELVNKKTKSYVYSCDEEGNLVPGLVTHGEKTGTKKLVKVILDNNQFIKCTPEHKFMMRDGSYKEAQYLQPNDSLMPLYRRLNDLGYEQVLNPRTNRWKLTHYLDDEYNFGFVKHHIDFNKRNNNPDNLTKMTWDDHTRLHYECTKLLTKYAQSEQGRTKSRELMNKLWSNEEFRERMSIISSNNGSFVGSNPTEKGIKARQENGKINGPINIQKALLRIQEMSLDGSWKLACEKAWETKHNNQTFMNEHKNRAINNLHSMSDSGKRGMHNRWHINRNTYDDQCESCILSHPMNHKVSLVEDVGYEDVYDITVDKYHNFALSAGVFVHNCIGYDDKKKLITFQNSWGRSWGINGRFYMEYTDVDLLIKMDGEACTPVE